jgi:hypothetical protein
LKSGPERGVDLNEVYKNVPFLLITWVGGGKGKHLSPPKECRPEEWDESKEYAQWTL